MPSTSFLRFLWFVFCVVEWLFAVREIALYGRTKALPYHHSFRDIADGILREDQGPPLPSFFHEYDFHIFENFMALFSK